MLRCEPTALAHDGRMKPEGLGTVKGELEVEFPIKGFCTGKKSGENGFEDRDAEDHGIRASRGVVVTIGRMPELGGGRIVGNNGSRGTQG